MAFIEDDFGVVGGWPGPTGVDPNQGQGINEFSYSTPDDLATVITDGYFNVLRDTVTQNNFIHVVKFFNFTIKYLFF